MFPGRVSRIHFNGGNYRQATNTPVILDRLVELRAINGTVVIGN